MKKTVLLAVIVFSVMLAVCISPANAMKSPGTLSVQLGLNYAQEVTFTGDGMVPGETQTKLSWAADYKYPLGDKFRIGVALFDWQFDELQNEGSHGGTAFCFMTSYMTGQDRKSEVFMGFGSDLFRFGYRSYMGKSDETEKGMFISGEFDVPMNDDSVNSFANIGVGYSF